MVLCDDDDARGLMLSTLLFAVENNELNASFTAGTDCLEEKSYDVVVVLNVVILLLIAGVILLIAGVLVLKYPKRSSDPNS